MAEVEKAAQNDVQAVLSRRASELLHGISSNKANWIYWLGLIPVFILSWYVRTRNLPLLAGKYLVELDSYFFFRYARTIYETGALPAIDMFRYSPLGFPTSSFRFFPETMAFFYEHIVHPIFPSLTQIQWHIYYPPAITLVSFVFFFLFIKELFGHRTALISTAFLGVIPAYIQRTSAGFADHEAMAALWMFMGLWLFVRMWKAKDTKSAVIYGLLSGLFTGMLSMTWGGYRFMLMSIAAFFVAAILFKQVDKKKAAGYFCWGALFLAMLSNYYSKKLIDINMFRAPDTGLIAFGFIAAALYFYLPKIKYMSRQVFAIVITAAIAMAPAILFGVISIDTIKTTFAPNPVRWAATVAESQQPSFFGGGSWLDQYGWLMWFAIFGAAFLLYRLYEIKTTGNYLEKVKQNKYGLAATLLYLAFIYIFTKGRSNTYLWAIIITFILLAVLYFLAKKQHGLFSDEKYAFLLSFVFIFLTLILANVQIRLLFAFAPVAALGSGFFVTTVLETLWKTSIKQNNSETGKAKYFARAPKIAALLFCALVLFVFYTSAVKAEAQNHYVGSMVPGQWDAAMAFIREQTPKDSVVTHWWDYGHMTAAVGERATVTDGGNVRSWNHASGRYFLTGKDKTSTLEYLKSHNVTHILISDQEIPKYPAFSLIGSDENFDRYSSIGIFALQDVKEARDGTMFLYGGGWSFDSNVAIGNLILPAGQASITAFSYLKQNNTAQSPKIYVSHSGKQFQFDLSCIYRNGQRISFPITPNTMKGCLILVPYFTDAAQGHEDGAALWASEKVWDTNFARLYMYNEPDQNFRLAYADQTPLAIYQGRIVGPIKIWEVNYPANIKPDEKYLEYSPYG